MGNMVLAAASYTKAITSLKSVLLTLGSAIGAVMLVYGGIIVVENKRLKTALMKLRNELDSGRSLDSCLDELEMSFSNGEISSFCTVIKSLQSTGQVDEALRTLENNIEREQVSVNKKRCIMLEHKTMMYVIFIAMDILAMILYCIIIKLLELQLGF